MASNKILSKLIKGNTINREYSWLEFNNRVLDQAMDLTNPLLERCKFLSIFKSNLDEFTMVRLGSLENQNITSPEETENKTGLTADEQIEAILSIYPKLYKNADHTYNFLKADLYDKGLSILKAEDLSQKQKTKCLEHFSEYMLPRINPLVLDQKHPMIRFQNLRTYMVLLLERNGRQMFGVITLSPSIERIYRIDGGKKVHLILSEDLLYLFGNLAFPGYTVKEKALIRITRNADFEASMEEADVEYNFDFSKLIKTKIEERTNLSPVRVEINSSCEEIKNYIAKQTGIKKNHIFESKTYFDYKFLFKLAQFFPSAVLPSLQYRPFKPQVDPKLKGVNLLSYVEKKDIFLSYPYDSMDTLITLLEQAGEDKSVTNIKITIYRLMDHSRIANALLRAAEHGKDVTAVMELCARFDEENNLYYANQLRDAGCTVFYGLGDYKVHSKIISITREKDGKVSYITHIGTGNYNEGTSKQYTDLNIITSNREIGEDGVAFFRNLAIMNLEAEYRRLLVAPYSLKKGLIAEIDKEIEKGEDGLIMAKMNSLTDRDMIEKLIQASQAGVRIYLCVRGICCLLPGIKGSTENISVISIVGRFLEHSRIYSFGKGKDERLYIGSADLMTRNINKRVEIAAPVLDKTVHQKIKALLTLILSDTVKGRRLNSDGTYSKIETLSSPIDSQEECLKSNNCYC